MIFQDLLRDALEDRRGNLPALMQANRRIQNHCHRDRRIVDRRKSGERSHVLGARIRASGRIDLLRGAGLARRAVAFENGFASRAVRAPRLCIICFICAAVIGEITRRCSLRDETRPSAERSGARWCRRRFAAQPRRHRWQLSKPCAASCSGVTPISWPIEIAPIETLDHRFTRLGHAAGFAGQLDAGLLPETEGANVFVEAVFAQAQRDLDGAHVARFGQDVGDGKQPRAACCRECACR